MAIEPPSNYYPKPIGDCSPFNAKDYENGYSTTTSVLNPANYLSYPTAQGTELLSSVQISQIQDSIGSYGNDNQVLQGTTTSKIKWTTLGASTSTYQTDVYRSSVQGTALFDIICPPNTTKVDIYAVGQGGWASNSGPKYVKLGYQSASSYKISVFGPATGSAGTTIIMQSIPAQEGVCFQGQFVTGGDGQYGVYSTKVFAVNQSDNILIANAGYGNWASDPNIGDPNIFYPGTGYVGLARGSGTGAIQNLTGSLLTLKTGDNGIDGLRWDYDYPIDGSYHPNPPYSQLASVNQAVQFYDEGGKAFGSGGYFTNLYLNGNDPGYLHADVNYPNDAAIIVISYINT